MAIFSGTALMTSPAALLEEYARKFECNIVDPEFPEKMDQIDPLGKFSSKFIKPKILPNNAESQENGTEILYFSGQSLGLQPVDTPEYVKKVLDNWALRAVESHFEGYLPAALCDLPPRKPMATLVGAKPEEIAIMNGLTVNLHLLLATFYKPTSTRHKIVIEEQPFPSDLFAVKSQVEFHGLNPETSLIFLRPRKGEQLIRHEDILKLIEEQGESIALILTPGVQFYTGQLFPIKEIVEAGHAKGCVVGADLAHAVGNVILNLHDWNLDFGCWCTYKYLNSGPGSIAAIFVHSKHFGKVLPAFRGWWGNRRETKFDMEEEFDPLPDADVFKLSNPSPLQVATLIASLDIFQQTSMEDLVQKQVLLTGYLEYLLLSSFRSFDSLSSKNGDYPEDGARLHIITPSNPEWRGCQLSLVFSMPIENVYKELQRRGVMCDMRKPSVLRLTPIPLYNSFTDVYKLVHVLKEAFLNNKK